MDDGVFPPKSLQEREKELHCASSVCNYHVHHIWNVHRWSFVSLFVRRLSGMSRQFVVAGDVKRSAGGVSVTTSWNEYSATYRTAVWPADRTIIWFSHQHVYSDNCSCLTEQRSRTLAVIWLSCACKHTGCGPDHLWMWSEWLDLSKCPRGHSHLSTCDCITEDGCWLQVWRARRPSDRLSPPLLRTNRRFWSHQNLIIYSDACRKQ